MEKNKSSKNKILKWIVIGVIVIGLFFVREDSIFNLVSNLKKLSVREVKLEHVGKVKLENPGETEIYGDNILNWKENNLEIMSRDGEVLDRKGFEIEDPNILYGEEKIYIIDRNLGVVHSFYENGQLLGKLKIDKGLFNLKEEYRNLITHIKSEDGEALKIYNSIGEEIGKQTNLKNILTYSIEEDRSKYLISIMDLDKDMKSKINVYNIDGELINSQDFPGEIILWTAFAQEKQLVLSNLNLYLLDEEGIQWKKPFPFLKDIDVVDGKIYVLYDSNLQVLNIQGETEEKFVFPKEYNKIFVYEEYGILYGPNDILGIKNGKQVFEYSIEDEIQEMYKTKELIGVRFNNYINLFKLEKK